MADNADGIADRIHIAGDALEALADGPAQRAADSITLAFRAAGAEIEDALAKAARSGEMSFHAMAMSIGRELSTLGIERFLRGPVSGLLDGVLGAGFAGARAGGGPVLPGGAYLVGETGPEIFRPAGAGSVEPVGARPITINVTVTGGGAPDLHRSQTQIAAEAGRAAARALRRL